MFIQSLLLNTTQREPQSPRQNKKLEICIIEGFLQIHMHKITPQINLSTNMYTTDLL